MNRITALLVLLGVGLVAGCSGENDDDGHVWQEQTETLDRAREAEDKIMQKAEEQRRAIEEIDQQ